MKSYTALTFILLSSLLFSQQTINSVMNGVATNPFVWDCTCIPSTNDNINIYHAIEMNVDWLVNSGGSITVHANGSFIESMGGIAILFDGASTTLTNYGVLELTSLAFTTGSEGHNHANMTLDTALFVGGNSEFMNHGLLNGVDSIVNQGTFMNEGTILNGDYLNDGVLMNTGFIVTDSLYNVGVINLSAGNITAFDCGSIGAINITGTGSLFVDNDFANSGEVFVDTGRDVMIGRDFISGDLVNSDALVDNNGIFHVVRDFSNGDTLKGTGLFCLGGASSNVGFVKETLDICDNTPLGAIFDVNFGTIEPGVTSCQSSCVANIDENTILDIHVYPNPISEKMSINVSAIAQGNIRVFDVAGRMIYERAFSEMDEIEVNTLSWDKGIYLVSVVSDTQRSAEIKVVK